MPAHIDTAPAVPMDLDAMARIAEHAGRSATADTAPVDDLDPAPVHRATVDAWSPLTPAGRLWRAAFRAVTRPGRG